MGRILGVDRGRGNQLIAMMHVVIPAEDFMIPLLPIFKRMAGGSEANDWLARSHEFFEMRELILRQGRSPHEENGEVSAIQGLNSGNIVGRRPLQIGAVELIIRLQQSLEGGKAIG